jgi:hypothetical protein
LIQLNLFKGEKDFILDDQGTATLWRGTLGHVGPSLSPAVPLYGLTPQIGFGPKPLRALRQPGH